MTVKTFLDATVDAVAEEMRRDGRIFAIGEDSGIRSGSFPIFKGIAEEFGDERLIGTPICEAATTSAALGAALTGLRPIVGLHFGDFMLRAVDDIGNQIARACYTMAGKRPIPVVIRAYVGVASTGTQHSGSYEGVFTHFPGLKVVMPATSYDVKGLLKASIRDDDPVVFLEHKRLLNTRGDVPDQDYVVPLGRADVKRTGLDATVVCYGIMVPKALAAAEKLAAEGIEVEVLDLRTLVPLDTDAIVESVSRTHRLVIAHEDSRRGGFGAEVAAAVAERAIGDLHAPIRRVANPDTPIPFSPLLEQAVTPGTDQIVASVREIVSEFDS